MHKRPKGQNLFTPCCLQLTESELTANANHDVRPVVTPKIKPVLEPIGYTEVINGGKSRDNEDQACIFEGMWPKSNLPLKKVSCLFTF